MPRYRKSWLACIALASFVAAGLASRHVAIQYPRPERTAYDTMMRFLPPGSEIQELSATRAPGVYAVRAERGAEVFNGRVKYDGTLLWLATPVAVQMLPSALRSSILGGTLRVEREVERFEIMAFATANGDEVGYVDVFGRSLLRSNRTSYEADHAENYPVTVRTSLEGHFPGARLNGAWSARGLESVVWRISWSGLYGRQAAEVLDDGLVRLVELPDTEPIPAAVGSISGSERWIAVLLHAYGVSDSSGRVEGLQLATGERVRWTFETRTEADTTR